jgi:ASC-1-like (ASCH) protein
MDMQLDTIHFDNIKNGKKIYETRLYDEKRRKINLLDVITFHDKGSKRTFKAHITELAIFKNFKDAIEEVGIKKVLPNVRSLEDGVKLYESFPSYKEGAKKYGVLRMRFLLKK